MRNERRLPHVDIGYNHWWQNWAKTHAYVAQRMFFPTSVDELAAAVKAAEADQRPLRAVAQVCDMSSSRYP